MRRYLLVAVMLSVALWPLWAGAQGEAQEQEQPPVAVTLESYLVTTVTLEDGTTEERFLSAETATPGEVLEYRLEVQNQSGAALPEGLALTGPVPGEVRYLDASATPVPDARLQFSADGGETFSEPPVMMTVTNEEGEEEEVVADPSQYNAVRWLLLTPLETEASLGFSYRVAVR